MLYSVVCFDSVFRNMFGASYFGAQGGYGGVEPAGEAGPCGGVQASQGHGGFIPEDDTARSGMQANSTSGKTTSQTLTPVTIRMLLDAASSGQQGPDSPFRVGGRELQLLTVVACVEGHPSSGDWHLCDSKRWHRQHSLQRLPR